MITAKEALALYDATGVEVKQFLDDKVLQPVKDAAMSGKRECTVHLGSNQYQPPMITKVVEGACFELKRLGYMVSYGFYGEEYVPRGLADDYGEGPKHRNYGITVRW